MSVGRPSAALRLPLECVAIAEPPTKPPDCLALDQRYGLLLRKPETMIKGLLLQ